MILAQLIYATFNDKTRTLLLTVGPGFDVESWARQRIDAFRLLGITEITYEEINDRSF